MKLVLEQFLVFLIAAGIFILTYVLLAGSAYLYFYGSKKRRWSNKKIQLLYPTAKSIHREIKWSLYAVLVMAVLTTGVLWLIRNGYTKLYTPISRHGWFYFISSIAGCIFVNDTYFYWLHRWMHLPSVFHHVHRVHHLSKAPTPWAIYAFSPLEALLDYLIFPLLLLFIPLHPLAISSVLLYNHAMNTLGHLGFEIVPKRWRDVWLFRFSLTVTHHEMHHSCIRYNFGLYFNIWDRLMKTNHPAYSAKNIPSTDKTISL